MLRREKFIPQLKTNGDWAPRLVACCNMLQQCQYRLGIPRCRFIAAPLGLLGGLVTLLTAVAADELVQIKQKLDAGTANKVQQAVQCTGGERALPARCERPALWSRPLAWRRERVTGHVGEPVRADPAEAYGMAA